MGSTTLPYAIAKQKLVLKRHGKMKCPLTMWSLAVEHWKNGYLPAMVQKLLLRDGVGRDRKRCDGVSVGTRMEWQAWRNGRRQCGVGFDFELEKWDRRARRRAVRGKVRCDRDMEMRRNKVRICLWRRKGCGERVRKRGWGRQGSK